MTYIKNNGSPQSRIWVVQEQPFPKDAENGFLHSSGLGWMFRKMMQEAGIKDYYVCSRRPDLDSPDTYAVIENEIEHYKPPIIIPLDGTLNFFCPNLEVSKYSGSLLTSSKVAHPHYIIPTLGPGIITRQWSERDIVVSLDLGKAASEYEYYQSHGSLQSLPIRNLRYEFDDFGELVGYLEKFRREGTLLSNDLEVVYPKNKKSLYWGHPGLPVTVGLANSKDFGISFELFRKDRDETLQLFRLLYDLFWNVPQLGQNFFAFDKSRYEMLGFRFGHPITDTMIRQHILWPELPKKLQFLTRQYTREPFYKDEGHGWSIKNLKGLRKYNCLDVCVTMEVWEAQEEEFKERPHLR